jgi:hypothetical protein
MNAKHLIAAVAVLSASASALAENGLPYIDYTGFDSARSRAEVLAEAGPGTAGHSTANNEYREFTTAGSALTRADVLDQLARDTARGGNALTRNPEFIESTHFTSDEKPDRAGDETIRSAKGDRFIGKASGS